MNSNDHFKNVAIDVTKDSKQSLPYTFYNRFGDSIHVMVKSGHNYSERIDDLVTVYRDIETGELLGFVIESLSELMLQAIITVKLGKVSITNLVLARYATLKTSNILREKYTEIYKIAESSGQEVLVPEEILDSIVSSCL